MFPAGQRVQSRRSEGLSVGGACTERVVLTLEILVSRLHPLPHSELWAQTPGDGSSPLICTVQIRLNRVLVCGASRGGGRRRHGGQRVRDRRPTCGLILLWGLSRALIFQV